MLGGRGSREKVTAEVGDWQTRVVYVSSAIHLYLDTLISTLKLRPCPLPLSLCFCSINYSHSCCLLRVFAQVCDLDLRMSNALKLFEVDVNVTTV